MTEHRHSYLTSEQMANRNRPPVAQVVELLAVDFLRGEGCCLDDPVRTCTAYYRSDGELLWIHEPSVTEGKPATTTHTVSWAGPALQNALADLIECRERYYADAAPFWGSKPHIRSIEVAIDALHRAIGDEG